MYDKLGRFRLKGKISGPLIIFVLLLVFFSLFARRFFTFSNAANIVRQASVLALAAFGQTFVILIAGIDLSIGAVMGLTSSTAAVLMVKASVDPIAAVFIAVIVSILCGSINGIVTNYIGLNPFVSTFGMWGMALGAGLIITEERVVFGFPETLRVFHDGVVLGIPVPLLIVLFIWSLLHFFLRRTPAGTATYAIGGNEESARLSGIPVRLQKTLIYTFSGFMAGLAGILFLSRANAAQAVDTIGFEFDSICAVVLGGTALAGGRGGVKETLIGVLLFATLKNGLNMLGVNLYLQLVFVGVILILSYIAETQKSKGRTLLAALAVWNNKKEKGGGEIAR